MGQLIIFEGLDGSGKGTQTKLTAQRLKEQGRDLRQITFPDYDSESSALVKMYLSGAFGDKPDDVNAYAASSFYAVDRFASYKTDWGEFYREGGLVLSDRYTTSNAVHQCSKLPPMHWDGFLNWLFDFEYKKFGIPAPDAVIYLAVDPEVSQRLITERYHGDESKKDIQEKDTEYLARSRAAAEYCARTLGWHRIECTAADANGAKSMRSVEDINAEILAEFLQPALLQPRPVGDSRRRGRDAAAGAAAGPTHLCERRPAVPRRPLPGRPHVLRQTNGGTRKIRQTQGGGSINGTAYHF